MNIKDPRVHELAQRLAALRGSSATAAVRSALEDAVQAELGRRAERATVLQRLQQRVASTCGQWLDDDELYDDRGLPR